METLHNILPNIIIHIHINTIQQFQWRCCW